MKFIKFFPAALVCALAASSSVALAANTPVITMPTKVESCSGSWISVVGASCLGVYSGNLNGNANTYKEVNLVLNQWNQTVSSAVASSNYISAITTPKNATSSTIDFSSLLYGDTIIGVHYGKVDSYNNVTVFYKFNAGTTGLDKFTTSLTSASNASLYKTGIAPAVPEPETYAMLLAGLGLVGWMRRRKSA
ncbi:PEP-CTERM sorting domain-containing protein [Oxalobacteraceae bacterium A2-2]